jgi:hypothetical protein
LYNPPPPEPPTGPLVDYPEYLAWKGFSPGAKVSYAAPPQRALPPELAAQIELNQRHHALLIRANSETFVDRVTPAHAS